MALDWQFLLFEITIFNYLDPQQLVNLMATSRLFFESISNLKYFVNHITRKKDLRNLYTTIFEKALNKCGNRRSAFLIFVKLILFLEKTKNDQYPAEAMVNMIDSWPSCRNTGLLPFSLSCLHEEIRLFFSCINYSDLRHQLTYKAPYLKSPYYVFIPRPEFCRIKGPNGATFVFARCEERIFYVMISEEEPERYSSLTWKYGSHGYLK